MLEFFKKLFGFKKKNVIVNDTAVVVENETPVEKVELVSQKVESSVSSEEVKKSKPRRRYSQKNNKSGEKKERVAKEVVTKETTKKKNTKGTTTEKVSKPRKPKTDK